MSSQQRRNTGSVNLVKPLPRTNIIYATMFAAIIAVIAGALKYFNYAFATDLLVESSHDIGDSRNYHRFDTVAFPADHYTNWGSWRPGIYFGLKSKEYPAFLTSGIMWGQEGSGKVRHEAVQDELTLFEWRRHNGRTFGTEYIRDEQMSTEINATFSVNSNHKSEAMLWSQRFDISQYSSEGEPLMFFFYFGLECDGAIPKQPCLALNPTSNFKISSVAFGQQNGNNLLLQSVEITGRTNVTGRYFKLHLSVFGSPEYKRADLAEEYLSYWAPKDLTATEIVAKIRNHMESSSGNKKHSKEGIFQNGVLSNKINKNSSSIALLLKVSKEIRVEATFYEFSDSLDHPSPDGVQTSKMINAEYHQLSSDFNKKFNDKIKNLQNYNDIIFKEKDEESAKRILSAVLGGIGLFSGHPDIGHSNTFTDKVEHVQQINRDNDAAIRIMSATPSRTSFPRAFLWDDGFHQLVISEWDSSLSLSTISDWLHAQYKFTFDSKAVKGLSRNYTSAIEMGWIPRELILGDSARKVVPAEFITQRVDTANPPTLLLVLEKLIDRHSLECSIDHEKGHEDGSCSIEDSTGELALFLKNHYSLLVTWMRWFFLSQRGPNNVPGSFAWRGRVPTEKKLLPNTLASGLDDYPRALFPNADEYHVDLYCWLAKSAVIMDKIEKFLKMVGASIIHSHEDQVIFKAFFSFPGTILHQNAEQPREKKSEMKVDTSPVEISSFRELADALLLRLDGLHWSEKHHMYADIGLHSDVNGKVETHAKIRCGDPRTRAVIDVTATLDSLQNAKSAADITSCPSKFNHFVGVINMEEKDVYSVSPGSEIVQHVPRLGYVSLFPFLLKLLPADSEKLLYILEDLEDPKKLWTPFGIRSLSAKDIFYQKRNAPGDNPYWRGYIWININYLTLSALSHYKSHSSSTVIRGRCESLYTKLRNGLVQNILKQYEQTGYLWEQYDDTTGIGIRGHPFAGWTVLVLNMITEKY